MEDNIMISSINIDRAGAFGFKPDPKGTFNTLKFGDSVSIMVSDKYIEDNIGAFLGLACLVRDLETDLIVTSKPYGQIGG